MDIKFIEDIYKLTDLIKESDEYKKLKDIENKMVNNPSFIELSNKYSNTLDIYNKNISLKINDDNITKQLSIDKTNLFNLDIVKEYNTQYKIVEDMLKEISTRLLDGVIKDESN